MGLGTGWVTRHEYCRQDPYFILYFFLELLLSLLSGFIFKSVLKSILGLILAAILRKKNTIRAVLMEIIILQALVKS